MSCWHVSVSWASGERISAPLSPWTLLEIHSISSVLFRLVGYGGIFYCRFNCMNERMLCLVRTEKFFDNAINNPFPRCFQSHDVFIQTVDYFDVKCYGSVDRELNIEGQNVGLTQHSVILLLFVSISCVYDELYMRTSLSCAWINWPSFPQVHSVH